jgi:hypothetical protein
VDRALVDAYYEPLLQDEDETRRGTRYFWLFALMAVSAVLILLFARETPAFAAPASTTSESSNSGEGSGDDDDDGRRRRQ